MNVRRVLSRIVAAGWMAAAVLAPGAARIAAAADSPAPYEDKEPAKETAPAAAPGTRPDTGGLQFSVPDDWPIEKRGGAVGPIPIEEYMKLRFDRMSADIQALQARVEKLEQGARTSGKQSGGPRLMSSENTSESGNEPETETEKETS